MKTTMYKKVYDYQSSNGLTLNDVYQEIQRKECKLSSALRLYVLAHYDSEGNFLNKKL